ncbi:MAG: ATP-binding protein [Archaeoglobales archaeon]|nr:MAG: ATP-binding protein [Archaeoglobales archaeon]
MTGREIEEFMRILNSRPDLITFVYGPINSGKTELISYLIKTLSKDFRVFYINLRGIYVERSEDFLKVLFDVRGRSVKECIRFALQLLPSEVITPKGKIPIPKSMLKQIFKERELENVFVYLETFLTEICKKKVPVLIVDELQVIGDLKVDELLIYKLFNLFIRLTKELHCCHVFAVTSDSLFIERVYSEAMLQGRCRYLLVDDFDFKTTEGFLKKYGFNKEEIELVWENFGGKPVYLVEAIKNKNRLKDFCKEMLNLRTNEIKQRLKILKELGYEVVIGSKRYEVDYEKVVSALRDVAKDEVLGDTIDEIAKRFLVRENILFFDLLKTILRSQSKLDLLAVRRILG